MAGFVLASVALSGCGQMGEGGALKPDAAEQAAGEVTAFPGAEGYGKYAAGGRGGKIMFVTTLDDEGPGSLRACIEEEEPRVCIFRVSGVIRFIAKRPIIRNPYITIAGQTAPGAGILLTHNGGEAGLTPLTIKDTHDVVVRHIRIRPEKTAASRGSNDAITIESSENVIIDHVSGSWARDENFNTYKDNNAITVSWSIFAEGIPPHDKCALLGGDATKAQNISFLNNMCVHNGDRNPDVKFPAGSCVEIINNVFYNAATAFAEIWELNGPTPISFVGNYFKAGPNTLPGVTAFKLEKNDSMGDAQIYSSDNFIDADIERENNAVRTAYVDQPLCPLTIKPLMAEKAYEQVTKFSGAMPRDFVDCRVSRDVINGTGMIVEKPGLLPMLDRFTPPEDLDEDGMADSWERAQGIDDTVFNPWEDIDKDGWPNLDEYLNYAHQNLLLDAENNVVGQNSCL